MDLMAFKMIQVTYFFPFIGCWDFFFRCVDPKLSYNPDPSKANDPLWWKEEMWSLDYAHRCNILIFIVHWVCLPDALIALRTSAVWFRALSFFPRNCKPVMLEIWWVTPSNDKKVVTVFDMLVTVRPPCSEDAWSTPPEDPELPRWSKSVSTVS